MGKETGKLERRKSYVVGKPPLKHNPRNIIPKKHRKVRELEKDKPCGR